MFKFNNGDQVKDIVTGLSGVVVARIDYLNGCQQYSIKAQKLDKKTGKPFDADWIDGQQLVLVKKDVLGVQRKDTGGPARGMTLPKL